MKNIENKNIPEKLKNNESEEKLIKQSSIKTLSTLKQAMISPSILESKLTMDSLVESWCISTIEFREDFTKACRTHLA